MVSREVPLGAKPDRLIKLGSSGCSGQRRNKNQRLTFRLTATQFTSPLIIPLSLRSHPSARSPLGWDGASKVFSIMSFEVNRSRLPPINSEHIGLSRCLLQPSPLRGVLTIDFKATNHAGCIPALIADCNIPLANPVSNLTLLGMGFYVLDPPGLW